METKKTHRGEMPNTLHRRWTGCLAVLIRGKCMENDNIVNERYWLKFWSDFGKILVCCLVLFDNIL